VVGQLLSQRRLLRCGMSLLYAAICFFPAALPTVAAEDSTGHSVARQWNEALLQAIRKDFARPTVHARNLFHVSGAMWDAFASYDAALQTLQHHEPAGQHLDAAGRQAAREQTISFAAYRILRWRFAASPGAAQSLAAFDQLMNQLGYDSSMVSTVGNTPAALGNRIAQSWINFGLADHSNEQDGYKSLFYAPVNEPLVPALPGNPDISDPNRWQPLALDIFEDQGGNVILGGYPAFLSPEWGRATPFALQPEDLTIYHRDGHDYWVYHDPGPPPQLGGAGDAEYKAGFEQVVLWSGLLDPADGPGGGALIDISPASRGNNPLGSNSGSGHAQNPVSGLPYAPQVVPAGDYYRVLAEFWSDGPESETPPGHWFTIANYVSDHPLFEKKFRGEGPVLDGLEWDVKLYLALGGTLHDVAVSAWGIKGWYDYTRPISAIRHMCDLGQSSDPLGPSYHPQGIGLYPGSIEVITEETAALGGRHFPLGGNIFQHVGKIVVRAWRGPDYIPDPATDKAGVGWIRCENWWPYQRPSFVTPPFAGYVSGHSTFSRAAATILAEFTGSEFFPGGLGEFEAPMNEFLVFEEGPSMDITLQWATYFDAADETSLSRIYGGIHPTQDDIPGRFIGAAIAQESFEFASNLFGVTTEPDRATFKVTKQFLGGDETDRAIVSIACNTGLILDPERELADGESVEFVVSSFADGALDCTIVELADADYVAEYDNVTADKVSTSGCDYAAVTTGDRLECEITNTVFFENIPVANRYGMAILALLLLTAGLSGFRRIDTA
jgi:hypothetical protein